MKTTDELIADYFRKGGQVTQLDAAPVPETGANALFQRKLKTKRPRPTRRQAQRNWAAQAAYDELHGTDNGYDPRIRDMNEFYEGEK